MLKMKLVQRVPWVAANMGYIKGGIGSASVNVSLLDYSRAIPSNTAEIGVGKVVYGQLAAGAEVDYPPYCFVSDRALVYSFESVTHPDVRTPTPLYYVHHIGKGPYQDDFDWPITMVWNEGDTPVTDGEDRYPTNGRLKMRALVEVIDEDGNIATDIKWDVRYTTLPGYTQVYEAPDSRPVDLLRIDILTDRPSCNGKTYFIRYRGYDTRTGEELPNHMEVLNARPMPLVGDPLRLLYDVTPHHVVTKDGKCHRVPVLTRSENCPGYYPATNIVTPMAEPWCAVPGIAVFGDGTWCVYLDSDGTTGRYTLRKGVDSHDLCSTAVSIAELCQAINSFPGAGLLAVPLSASHESWPMWSYRAGGPEDYIIPTSDGAVGRMLRMLEETVYMPLHFKHRYDMAIRPHVPFGPSVAHTWYPRIAAGEFTEVLRTIDNDDRVYIELRYGIPEFYRDQEWSQTYEPGVREATNESGRLLDEHTVQVKRYPIHRAGSIKVRHPERGVIQPYDTDLENGKLLFEDDLTDVGDLSIDYAFNDNLFDYRHVDLNPAARPDLVGKYVGVFMIPMEIHVVSGEYTDAWDGVSDDTYYPGLCEITNTGTGAG